MRDYLCNFVWKMTKIIIRLLLLAEVLYLSKSECLSRFYALFDSVLEFIESKGVELQHNSIKNFCDFRDTNLKLQADQSNLIQTKSEISAFVKEIFSTNKTTSKKTMFSISKSNKNTK